MQIMSKKISTKLTNSVVFAFVAILLVYFYLYVDLSLVYHVQQPFFATNFNFLENYLSYPGGISGYFGLFIIQFYGNESAALVLVLLQIGIWFFLIYQLIKNYLPPAYLPVPLILSAIPLIVGLGTYFFPTEISIAFIIAVGFAIIYRNVKLKNTCNYLIYFLIAIFDYYITGSIGLSVFLAITVAFLVYEKKYISLLICIVWITVLPFLWHLFDRTYTSLMDAYYGHFIKDSYDHTTIIIYYVAPILVFIILLISLFLSSFLNKANVTKWLIIFNFIVILPVIYLVTFSATFQPAIKNAIQLDRLAYEEKWDELLNSIDEQNIKNESILSLANRALYHKGILLDYLFYYPQSFRQEALIVKDPIVPLSEIYFDLGFINESRHWANEALIVLGNSAGYLKAL